jgi:signal transduction histidine kinase
MVLIAAQLGLTQTLGRAVPWIATQTVVMGYLGCFHWEIDLSIYWASATAGFEILSLMIAGFAAGETRARAELARANVELRATRALLAESTRAAERVQISRDLHDVIGHHLTALSLHLEVAKHTNGADGIEKAQQVTKQLLGDVRGVVGALREERITDLRAALRELVAGVDRPRVHLAGVEELEVADDARARVLLRSAQEIVTNAIRHADADELWIDIAKRDGRIAITARDDGRGPGSIQPGNGLRGMRERFEGLGGELAFVAEPGRGFRIEGWLPE